MSAAKRTLQALGSGLLTAVLSGALAAASLLVSGDAHACSCMTLTDEAHFAAASAVFEGRVVSIVRLGDPDVGPARLAVTFEVVQTWKAANAERVVVNTASDGAACGYGFEQDRSYLVYASAGDDGGLVTGLCSGTTLREDADAAVTSMGAGVTPVDVTDEAPTPATRTTAPGAGGCASCNVGAGRSSPEPLLGLVGAAVLGAVATRRRRR